MTKDQIEKMEAGEEIDALIAENIFGSIIGEAGPDYYFGIKKYIVVIKNNLSKDSASHVPLPEYSRKIEEAFKILDKLHMRTVYIWWNDSGSMWQVWLDYGRRLQEDCRWSACDDGDDKDEPNLALAICRAALLATIKEE